AFESELGWEAGCGRKPNAIYLEEYPRRGDGLLKSRVPYSFNFRSYCVGSFIRRINLSGDNTLDYCCCFHLWRLFLSLSWKHRYAYCDKSECADHASRSYFFATGVEGVFYRWNCHGAWCRWIGSIRTQHLFPFVP